MYANHELSQRLERLEGLTCREFVEARARVMPGSDACWKQVGDTCAMFDGPASPITQTFGLGMSGPSVTPEMLDELEEFFFSRSAPVNHEVSPFAGVEVHAILAARGYRPIELTSILFRPVSEPLLGTVNSNIHVRKVEADEIELWTDVTARGWASELPGMLDSMRDMGRVIAAKSNSVNFLAELDGTAIAAGSLSLSDREALFAGAATVPEGRRQGAQFALLDARLRYAAEHGCDLAMMGAAVGSSSQRNAERNKFRIAYTRVKWSLINPSTAS